MNDQQCCIVNQQTLYSPCGPYILKYWSISPGNHSQFPRQDDYIYSASPNIPMLKGLMSLFGLLQLL